MRSRITVEIDYSNGNEPVIQILRRKSDDVRDGMIQSFIQALGHASVWCRVECVGNHMPNHHFDEQGEQRWYLRPLKPEQLSENVKEMSGLAAVIPAPESPKIFMVDGFPRRARLDLYEPAEKSIHSAVEYIENMGADVRLTDAVIMLQKAKDKVSDYIDEQRLSKK